MNEALTARFLAMPQYFRRKIALHDEQHLEEQLTVNVRFLLFVVIDRNLLCFRRTDSLDLYRRNVDREVSGAVEVVLG